MKPETQQQKQLDYPVWRLSFDDYGGNFLPDRIEANNDRYSKHEEIEDVRIEARLDAVAEREDQMEDFYSE